MKNNNLINKSYFMAGLLSNSFFISEILFNLLYQNTSDTFIYYAFTTFILILILSPLAYRYFNQRFTSNYHLISKITLIIYLLVTTLLTLLAVVDFVEVHWLSDTSVYVIVISLMAIILYATMIGTLDFYKANNILLIIFGIIILGYFIFKSNYIYLSFCPYVFPKFYFNLNALFISFLILFEAYTIFILPVVNQTNLSKKTFYTYILTLILFIGLKAIIHYNEFQGILDIVLYPFFESYSMIYFGQYIGYLNFPILFYYIIGGFCKIGFNLKIMQTLITNYKTILIVILLLSGLAILLLIYNQLMTFFKIPMIVIALISLVLTLVIYKEKRS